MRLFGSNAIVFIAIIVVMIIYYFTTSKVLNQYCMEKEKHFSILAWIPVARLYLLGKYTIHKIFGYILIVMLFVMGSIKIEVDGVENTYSILPESISEYATYIFFAIEIVLFLFIYVNLEKKKEESDTNLVKQAELFHQDDAIMKSLEKPPEIEDFRVVKARQEAEMKQKENNNQQNN